MPLRSLIASLTTTTPSAPAGRVVARVQRSGPASMSRLACALLEGGQNVVIVAPDAAALAEYRSLLGLFSPELSSQGQEIAATQWNAPFISLAQRPPGKMPKGLLAERMAALYALENRRSVQGVVVTLDNFLYRLPPVSIFRNHELRLYKGMEMAPELVLDQAVDWGYVRSPMVSMPGEVAMRGDILDIFCPGYSKPLRLEFFGDTLDDIRLFNPSSQRSVADCAEVHVLPVAPVIASKALMAEARAFWQQEAQKGLLGKEILASLGHTLEQNPTSLGAGVYYANASCLEDWLPPDSIFLLPDSKTCSQELLGCERSFIDHLTNEVAGSGSIQPPSMVLRPVAEVEALFAKARCVSFEDLRMGVTGSGVDDAPFVLPESRYTDFASLFSDQAAQERPWQHLMACMKSWASAAATRQKGRALAVSSESELGKHCFRWFGAGDNALGEKAVVGCGKFIACFSSERSRERFLKLAEQEGLFPQLRYDPEGSGLFALVAPFRKGISLAWEHTVIAGEDVLQPRVEKSVRPSSKSFQGLDRYDALQDGDYLVHRDYGVGMFGGLHRMALGDVESDYLLLLYAADDKLYLPVDRLSLVQRFKTTDEGVPARDRLGGSLWSSSKEKARKAIEKIAADLVEMYALRKVVKGFRYAPINEMYREFEATFGFEETPDQARAIEEVLADMEKPEPMDRLVCGDVGFGKTEVALRAAFRAALEGRQVALLCPTTVLAEQHYQTFRSRLAGFPVNVGLLSRFVPKAKQKTVLEQVAKAQTDILIGTHRILSKDVVLPNLGLLVLDEEQRFGVRHKERLKEMRKNVDALTLTATPIPRTLQLSLSGIRELSVIETPPPERKPVATALIERDEHILRDVVQRELTRNGQVFWVYNRVEGLERVVDYVKRLVPEARVSMAHGQMSEAALEKAMHGFWLGDVDVLVCTSIIESGLDFPKANTLVVDQAHYFGLGQLYQLRGRVGRSDRQAFAVFVTPEMDRLSDVSRQRLKIILEMDYLGAGFQVAMEDLRLRGAGNILGESQSGHMNRIGLDLFLEMLEEAVAKFKGQNVQINRETELALGVPALIPESYIPDARDRLMYYKQLSSAVSAPAQQDIELELRDRFGPFPPELENFSSIIAFKRVLTRWGATKADILPDKVRIAFSESSSLDMEKLVAYVVEQQSGKNPARLMPPATLELPFAVKEHPKNKQIFSIKEGLQTMEVVLYGLMASTDAGASS